MRYVLSLLAFPLFAIVAFSLVPAPHANADGSCDPSHDQMDEVEFRLLARIQEYRDANLDNSSPLTPSGPLIRAAHWYAEHTVARKLPDDKLHIDEFGRDTTERVLDCGWPAVVDLHEGGLYTDSFAILARAMPYRNAEVPDEPGQPPLHCVGIGHSTAGDVTLWIMLIASYEGDCPEPQLPPAPMSVAEDPGDGGDSFLSGGIALSLGLGLVALVGVAAVVGIRVKRTRTRQDDGQV